VAQNIMKIMVRKLSLIIEPESTSYSQRLAIILSQNDLKQTHILTTIYLHYSSILSHNIRANFQVAFSPDFFVSDILT